MHEAAIAENVIRSIEERLERKEIAGRITRIFMQVGRLRGVVSENLKFMFEVLAQGSRLEGARLEIETVPVRARCRDCQAGFQIDDLVFRCSSCHSARVEVLSGNELQISEVEVG